MADLKLQAKLALRTPRYNRHSDNTNSIRTAAKYHAKMGYRHLTEINSRYNRLSLIRTLSRGPQGCPL